MARSGRFGHASLARCSQNRPFRIACRRGAGWRPTKADSGAGCPTGRRPCGDRICRLNIGCCRSHGRRRSIPPGRQVGICLSIETVVAAKPSRMIPRSMAVRKLSIPWGAPGSHRHSRRCPNWADHESDAGSLSSACILRSVWGSVPKVACFSGVVTQPSAARYAEAGPVCQSKRAGISGWCHAGNYTCYVRFLTLLNLTNASGIGICGASELPYWGSGFFPGCI